MKRFWIPLTLISMLLAAPAFAQSPYPDDDDDDSGTIGSTMDDDDDNSMAMKSGGNYVPTDRTVGIGAGLAFPGEIFTFNTFLADFNLADGDWQVAPLVTAGLNRGTTKFDDGTTDTEDKDGTTFIGVGARAKKRLAEMPRARLHGIATGLVAFNSAFTDPDGSDNNLTDSTIQLSLGWGLGVEVWILRWLSMEATATNPLVTFTTNTQEQDTPTDPVTTSTNSFQFEATFDPSVAFVWKVWFN